MSGIYDLESNLHQNCSFAWHHVFSHGEVDLGGVGVGFKSFHNFNHLNATPHREAIVSRLCGGLRKQNIRCDNVLNCFAWIEIFLIEIALFFI